MYNSINALGKALLTSALVITIAVSAAEGGSAATCGDVNGDNQGPDISDIMYLVNHLFLQGPAPVDVSAADCTGDGYLDISDITALVNHLFVDFRACVCVSLLDHTDSSSSCLSYPSRRADGSENFFECLDNPPDTTEYMYAEWVPDELRVYHMNATYQCCLVYDYQWHYQSGDTVVFKEVDLGEPCDCLCPFNLQFTDPSWFYVDPRVWTVILLGIEGDTVGVDTALVGSFGDVRLEVAGGDVTLHHDNAVLNCCADFHMIYGMTGNNIVAQEYDSLAACMCICRYNLTSTMHDLAPGYYTLTLLGANTWPLGGSPFTGDTIAVETFLID